MLGTFVAVYGTISTPAVSTYAIDGTVVHTLAASNMNNSRQYMQLFFSSQLPNGRHTLVINSTFPQANLWLDYLEYTRTAEVQTTTSATASTAVASSSAAGTNSSSSPGPPLSTIIGGTLGGVVALLLLLTLIVFHQRQRLRANAAKGAEAAKTMSPAPSGKGNESGAARILGSGTSGIAELLIFHPVDTVAKRLMSNKAKVVSFSSLSSIIFRDASAATLPRKLLSLFPGLGYAAGYKVAQRVYKFGGQPWFNDLINKHYKTGFTNTFGERKGKLMMQATAGRSVCLPQSQKKSRLTRVVGSLTGIGEVVLLPLDALKIKRQVNPEAFRGRGVVRIFLEEGTTLYRGWGWTMARNAPGSFALFGASAFTKDYVLGVSDYSKATWTQNFIASVAGAVASITIAAPLDVVKTRIQNANFEHKVHGLKVVSELVKNEGVTAFFKGLTPKILVVGPKLVFSYTLAQSLIPFFANYV
ncbi:hypothetical protein C0995_012474 [Termitomyces sp. Mi166|nr:hypothetical protein C0995_012474 [Termitomyces sp. Mi166\